MPSLPYRNRKGTHRGTIRTAKEKQLKLVGSTLEKLRNTWGSQESVQSRDPAPGASVQSGGSTHAEAPVHKRPAAHGRQSAASNPRTLRQKGESDIRYETWGQFRKSMKEWAGSLVPGKVLRIHSEPKDIHAARSFRYKLMCASCATCRTQLSNHRPKGTPPPEKAWHAYVECNGETNTLTKEFTPLDWHGDFSYMNEWTQLTSTTEAQILKRLQQPGRTNVQELLTSIAETQDRAPDEKWLQRHVKKVRAANKGAIPPRPNKSTNGATPIGSS